MSFGLHGPPDFLSRILARPRHRAYAQRWYRKGKLDGRVTGYRGDRDCAFCQYVLDNEGERSWYNRVGTSFARAVSGELSCSGGICPAAKWPRALEWWGPVLLDVTAAEVVENTWAPIKIACAGRAVSRKGWSHVKVAFYVPAGHPLENPYSHMVSDEPADIARLFAAAGVPLAQGEEPDFSKLRGRSATMRYSTATHAGGRRDIAFGGLVTPGEKERLNELVAQTQDGKAMWF